MTVIQQIHHSIKFILALLQEISLSLLSTHFFCSSISSVCLSVGMSLSLYINIWGMSLAE